MSFKAQQRKIGDIFTVDAKYIIPRYQRMYIWGEKEWRELFEDLQFTYENEGNGETWSHFLGSFVLEKQQNKKEFIVIDGQQRITTLLIMFSVICRLYNELQKEELFKGTKKYIVGTDDEGRDYIRVSNEDLRNLRKIVAECTDFKPTIELQRPILDKTFSKSTQQDTNILNCYNFFYNNFTRFTNLDINNLNKLRDKISDLNIVEIIVTNEQEGYNIFEIVNARGVDLEDHELLKNYIFKYIRPSSIVDKAKEKWNLLNENVYIENSSVLSDYLSHYTTHKYQKPDKKNNEFRIIRDSVDKHNVESLLNDIVEKSEIYRQFYIPQECQNEIVSYVLDFFRLRKHRQFRPLFLSLISAYQRGNISKPQMEDYFIKIQNFYFIWGVVGKGTSNIVEDTIYFYAKKIENEYTEGLIDEFIRVLVEKFVPDESTFINKFIEMGYSKNNKKYNNSNYKRDIQYILSEFEKYYDNNAELKINQFTIEHIASDNGEDDHCKIGNLIPLSENLNYKSGNDLFVAKLDIYRRSDFKTVKRFLDRYGSNNAWVNDDIQTRGKRLAQLAYREIWKI